MTVTNSQHFTGSCCLNPPGKKPPTLQKNEPHAILISMSSYFLVPYFDKIVFWQRLYERAYGKPIYWNPVCLKTSWVCPYVWLILRPYFMFKTLSLRILEESLLVLLVGIILIPNPLYATRFHSGSFGDFMMTCSDVGPSYSNSWCWTRSSPFQSGPFQSIVAPFNQEAHVLPFWGISLCYFFDNFLSLLFLSNCLPLCFLFYFPGWFYLLTILILLLLFVYFWIPRALPVLFFSILLCNHSILTELWMPPLLLFLWGHRR